MIREEIVSLSKFIDLVILSDIKMLLTNKFPRRNTVKKIGRYHKCSWVYIMQNTMVVGVDGRWEKNQNEDLRGERIKYGMERGRKLH